MAGWSRGYRPSKSTLWLDPRHGVGSDLSHVIFAEDSARCIGDWGLDLPISASRCRIAMAWFHDGDNLVYDGKTALIG